MIILNNSASKNINILEIGTARGYSSICMADVLEDLKIQMEKFFLRHFANK